MTIYVRDLTGSQCILKKQLTHNISPDISPNVINKCIQNDIVFQRYSMGGGETNLLWILDACASQVCHLLKLPTNNRGLKNLKNILFIYVTYHIL